MIYLALYLHILGCVFWFLVHIEQSWMPPLDYVWVKTDIYERSIYFQYLSSLYHSVLMLTGNDMGPRTVYEYIFLILAVTGGAIVNALLFGELAVIISTLNLRQSRFNEKLEGAQTAMKNIGLPSELQNEVQSYLQ